MTNESSPKGQKIVSEGFDFKKKKLECVKIGVK